MCSRSRGHCRLTGAWFMRSVSPLFMASPNLTALNIGPYAPTTATVPPLRAPSIAQLSAIGEPPCSFNFAEVTCCRNAPSASAPAVGGDGLEGQHDVAQLAEVVGLGVGELPRLLEAVVEVVEHDHAAGTHEPG